jgi:glycosyltransferase involved in cell wall biosynthesis
MAAEVKSEKEMSDGAAVRVLLVAPDLPLVGGQTIQAKRLIDGFRDDEEIYIELLPINPSFLPRLQKIKYVRTALTESKYVAELFRKIPRCDVVHIFSASYFSFLLAPTPAVLIAKLFGKPTILNYRSGEAEDHLTRWRRTVSPIVRLFDFVVTPSGYLVEVFSRFGFEASTIFNSLDVKRFRYRPRKPLRPVFLSNRNFEELYNVSCTLRAFAIIQKRFPDSELLIAGEGNERQKLESLAAELKLENVTFLERVSPDDMPGVYDRADIYLNSPNIDNMPNSVIEAFSCGLPVVTTNAGGIPFIVENGRTGMLVEVNDHEGLAEAAVKVLEDPSLAERLILNARAECEKYTWDNVKPKWTGLYKELANRPASLTNARKTIKA